MAETLQLKRASSNRWIELNPILAAGEPAWEKDTNRLKVGDGTSTWTELPYIGDESVINAATHYDFPTIGRENTIYKAENESALYQWDATNLKYVVLSQESSGVLEIECINGGNATL